MKSEELAILGIPANLATEPLGIYPSGAQSRLHLWFRWEFGDLVSSYVQETLHISSSVVEAFLRGRVCHMSHLETGTQLRGHPSDSPRSGSFPSGL